MATDALEIFREQGVTISKSGSEVRLQCDGPKDASLIFAFLLGMGCVCGKSAKDDLIAEFDKLAKMQGNDPIRCSRMHFAEWAERLRKL